MRIDDKLFKIILKKEPEGSYSVTVPSLPGCFTWGESVEEAIEMAKEAIQGHIEIMKMKGFLIS